MLAPIRLILIVPFRGFILSDKMIRNFSDHSANERTFLAWVRTAIAVMAFGFLVEKFDLFLELAAPSSAGRTLSLPGQKFGNIAGLALIVLGTAMVGIAGARFVMTAKNIDREDLRPGNRIANRHRTCGAAGPSGLRSIPLCVARPYNEALTDFRKRFAVLAHSPPGCETYGKGFQNAPLSSVFARVRAESPIFAKTCRRCMA
jgi:putative membrane protein